MITASTTSFQFSTVYSNYLALAYQRAGIDPANWQPEKGFRFHRTLLDKLYYYYQGIYHCSPERFLWAGLARLTGGQVLYGMQNLVRIARDPCALTVNIIAVAKAIFENLSWQHELLLDDPALLLMTAEELDRQHQPVHSYVSCWKKILEGDAAEGNKMLLQNEQHNTIQPYYDLIRKDAYSSRFFRFTRLVMRNIHPHHSRFIFYHPFGDVTRFPDRWKWIDGPGGMWATWIACGQKERDRLVSLSNEAVISHKW